jgi:hypothetical protein
LAYSQTTINGDWNFRANDIAWLPYNSGGVELYNTADITTNYERAFLRWDTNVFRIVVEAGGGGTLRDLRLGDANNNLTINNAANRIILFTQGYTAINSAGANADLVVPRVVGEVSGVAGLGITLKAYSGAWVDVFKVLNAAGHGQAISESTIGYQVFELHSISAGDDPNYISIQNRVATTDATTTTLHSIPLVDTNVYLIEARVVARCTGGAGGNVGLGASYILKQAFRRSGGGSVAIGVLTTESWEDAAILAAWTSILDTNVNDVRVRVTGGATDNVTWHVTVIIQNLSS